MYGPDLGICWECPLSDPTPDLLKQSLGEGASNLSQFSTVSRHRTELTLWATEESSLVQRPPAYFSERSKIDTEMGLCGASFGRDGIWGKKTKNEIILLGITLRFTGIFIVTERKKK